MKADRRAIDAALGTFDAAIRLILIHGPDEAQSRELAGQFSTRLAPADDPMGRVDIDKSLLAADPARLADEAAAVSMFGDTKLIRVDGAGEESAAAVDALLETPAAGNPVVMTAGALKPTSKLLKAAIASPLALAFQCFAPDARAASAMVAEACAAHGLRPSREAQALLAANFGGERGVLARELEKLALYLGAEPGRETPLDIEALAAIGTAMSDADFGGLVDAVADGDAAEAERQAAKLNRNGIVGIAQLRAVARRFWVLAELGAAIEAGGSAREAVEALRPPVFWKDRDRIARQAAAWPAAKVRRALSSLIAAERRIKSPGSAAADVLTSHTLIAIARSARGAYRRRGQS